MSFFSNAHAYALTLSNALIFSNDLLETLAALVALIGGAL
jgi:hypothetical protein